MLHATKLTYSNKDTPPSSAILYEIMSSNTSKLPHQSYLLIFWVSMLSSICFLTIINMISGLGSLSYCMALELEVSLVGHSQKFYTTNTQAHLEDKTIEGFVDGMVTQSHCCKTFLII